MVHLKSGKLSDHEKCFDYPSETPFMFSENRILLEMRTLGKVEVEDKSRTMFRTMCGVDTVEG